MANAAPASDQTATSITDLPAVVLRDILSRISKRRIAGTKRHAAVSQLWRQLAAADAEPLHLLVQQDKGYEGGSTADAAEVLAYLQLHGRNVLSLHLLGYHPPKPYMLQQALCASSGGLPNVRSLVLPRGPSFLDLGPYLPRLPHLQHLTTEVHMAKDTWHSSEGAALADADGTSWCPAVPNMAHLCPPSLTSLNLELRIKGMVGVRTSIPLDSRLRWLLPPGLRHLQLKVWGASQTALTAGTLRHLSHLRHLSLIRVTPAAVTELHQLGSLQGVALPDSALTPGDLVSLSDKVKEYDTWRLQDPSSVELLTGLTALSCGPRDFVDAPDLAPLSQLQQLCVCGLTPHTGGAWLAGLTRLTSLRRLVLVGEVLAEQLAVVSQLTWLTSLAISELGLFDPADQQEEEGEEEEEQEQQQQQEQQQPWLPHEEQEGQEQQQQQQQQLVGAGWAEQGGEQQQQQQQQQRQDPRVPLVSALHGLAHLEVREELLLAPGAHQMLDALTALTRLDLSAMNSGKQDYEQACFDSLREWLGVGPAQLAQQQQQAEMPADTARRLQGQVEHLALGQLPQQQQQQQGRKLQQVVYYCFGYMEKMWAPPGWVLPSPLPGVRVTVLLERPFSLEDKVLLPQRPFPALKGVWEMAS